MAVISADDDPDGGRKTLVDLTEEVQAAGARRRKSRAEGTLAALADVDPVERDALIAALGRLHQLLVAGQPPRGFPAPPAALPC